MRKNVLKTGAALMAAVMVAATPMTVKADELPTAEAVNGIADKAGYEYIIPTIGKVIYSDGTQNWFGEEYVPSYIKTHMRNKVTVCDDEWWGGYIHSGEYLSFLYQPGYEAKTCYVDHFNHPDDSRYEVDGHSSWYFNGDGCTDYELIFQDDYSGTTIYNFSATDTNGVVYPDCKFIEHHSGDAGVGAYTTMMPQGFKGNIILTIFGCKLENGEAVRDDSNYLKFYLWGDPAATEQPAPAPEPTEQPAPAPEPTEQPAPVPETAEQPAPTTSSQGTIYVIKSGDNLKKIAKEVYGDRNLWEAIYEQNKDQIKNPNIIYANMHLILP